MIYNKYGNYNAIQAFGASNEHTIELLLGDKSENIDYYIFPNMLSPLEGFNNNKRGYNDTLIFNWLRRETIENLNLLKPRMERLPDFDGRKLAAVAIKTVIPYYDPAITNTPTDYGYFIKNNPVHSETATLVGNIITYDPQTSLYEPHISGWYRPYYLDNRTPTEAAQQGLNNFVQMLLNRPRMLMEYIAPYGEILR